MRRTLIRNVVHEGRGVTAANVMNHRMKWLKTTDAFAARYLVVMFLDKVVWIVAVTLPIGPPRTRLPVQAH